MGRKVRPGKPKKRGSSIKPQAPRERKLTFSFQLLDDSHENFRFHDREASYFLALVERLKSLSALTAGELQTSHSKAHRCHKINWNSTSQSGFPNLPEQLQDYEPFQLFAISSNQHGRVHGIFIDSTAYIIWLDPGHALYR